MSGPGLEPSLSLLHWNEKVQSSTVGLMTRTQFAIFPASNYLPDS